MKDCCSLEIAKKLKEVGWKQGEFQYFYAKPYSRKKVLQYPEDLHDHNCCLDQTAVPQCPAVGFVAPTIGELAHALPMDIHIDKLTRDGKECYRVTLTQDEKMDYDTIEDTLADTLGACLVSLMKDGYKPPTP